MDIKVNRGNRDIQLASWMGYESGLGERMEFQFASQDKAWNDCWLLIKDTVKEKGWEISSKDTLEIWFKRGYAKGANEKAAKQG
jgi:hypothetical protein